MISDQSLMRIFILKIVGFQKCYVINVLKIDIKLSYKKFSSNLFLGNFNQIIFIKTRQSFL